MTRQITMNQTYKIASKILNIKEEMPADQQKQECRKWQHKLKQLSH